MIPKELATWAEDLEALRARLAHLFARSQPQKKTATYRQGLLTPILCQNR
jgi:hypothetical protein